MNLEEKISAYENNDSISSENKKIRLIILETALKKDEKEKEIKSIIDQFALESAQFKQVTNNSFQISNNVEDNILELREYISNTDIVRELERQNIPFRMSRLKMYAIDYSKRYNIDVSLLLQAIELFETLENIKKINNERNIIITNGLSNLVDINLLTNKDEIIYETDSIFTKKQIKKPNIDMKANKEIVLKKISDLYQKQILDSDTTEVAIELLNNLFDSYKDNNIEIPVIENRQK